MTTKTRYNRLVAFLPNIIILKGITCCELARSQYPSQELSVVNFLLLILSSPCSAITICLCKSLLFKAR